MQELTTEQLQNQAAVINSARFLMENVHAGSEATIKELNDAFMKIQEEIVQRHLDKRS